MNLNKYMTWNHIIHSNLKPNLLNVVIFVLIEQNGSYVIR